VEDDAVVEVVAGHVTKLFTVLGAATASRAITIVPIDVTISAV
jgi:hypothetical protein